jgi:HlyD family secretion protein
MRRRLSWVALGLMLAAAAGWGVRQWNRAGKPQPDTLRVSGTIEITDAEVSFKLAGRLLSREVTEGQPVQAGQVIARLETNELVQQVALRRAELEAARAALAELEAGTRPEEIAQAEAALELARAEAAQAELELTRQRDLRSHGAATARELELAQTTLKTATARVREAEARLTMLRNGPRPEQIAQARARVEQAAQALALAETRLADATAVSPLTGVVLAKHVEPGEYVAAGTPVVTVGDLAHPWLRAYINETDLGRVKLGQRATITTDTYPGKSYWGTVTFISDQAEFTPKNVQTHQERVKLVYRIKIEVANPHQELKPGMPADALIHLDSEAVVP